MPSKTIHKLSELTQVVQDVRRANRSIGVVPTMGALHAGHISLAHSACEQADVTIATIFVNPTQFAAGEDLEKYPRTLEADVEQLSQA